MIQAYIINFIIIIILKNYMETLKIIEINSFFHKRLLKYPVGLWGSPFYNYYLLLVFKRSILLFETGFPRTLPVDQVDVKLLSFSVSESWVLGLKASATTI